MMSTRLMFFPSQLLQKCSNDVKFFLWLERQLSPHGALLKSRVDVWSGRSGGWRLERLAVASGQPQACLAPSEASCNNAIPQSTTTHTEHHRHHTAAGNPCAGTSIPSIATTTTTLRHPHYPFICDTTPLSRWPSSERRCRLPANHHIHIPHHGRCRCLGLEHLRWIFHRSQHTYGLRRRCETLRDYRITSPEAGVHQHASTTSQSQPSTRRGQRRQEHRDALPRGLP
jgi:hypothetical protein